MTEPDKLRLGGMALRNGLLIHGPTSWAAAARTTTGEIEVASGPKPTLGRGRLGSTPLLRGPLRLAEAMAVIPLARSRLASARLPFEASLALIPPPAFSAIEMIAGAVGAPVSTVTVKLLEVAPTLPATSVSR